MITNTNSIDDIKLYIESGITETYLDTPCNFFENKKEIFTKIQENSPTTKTENISILNAKTQAEKILSNINSIQELQNAIRQFDLNPLTKFASNSICGTGVETPTLLVITETPDKEEDKTGIQLSGETGTLLKKILQAINCSTETNTFVFPASFYRAPGGRLPTTEEMEITKPFINKFIHLLKPKFILTMGGIAFSAITNNQSPITAIRGQWFNINNTKVIATFSLPYLQNNKEAKKKAWEDLQKLALEF